MGIRVKIECCIFLLGLAAGPLTLADASQPEISVPKFKRSSQVFERNLNTWGVACADIDNDGDADIVLATLDTRSLVLINDGKGYFVESGQEFPNEMHGIDIGDVDLDGDLDLFFAPIREQRHPLFLNNGRNSFESTSFISHCSESVKLIDLENDGDLDAYFATKGRIYLNDGTGNFVLSDQSLPGFGGLCDLNNDGFVDFFAVGVSDEQSGFAVFVNKGDGRFAEHDFVPKEYCVFGYFDFADVDNDGDMDVVYTNPGRDKWHASGILLNDGSGRLTDSHLNLPTAGIQGKAKAGDLNGDGFVDVIITNADSPARIMLNDRTGKMIDSGLRLGEGKGYVNCLIQDFDNDGDKDIFLANRITGNHGLWFNQGVGGKSDNR